MEAKRDAAPEPRAAARGAMPWPLLLLLALAPILLTKHAATSWNDASRMATVQALVEHGTFAIDATAFVATGDKVRIGGQFYSDKPVMPALLGALVYWPLHASGLRLTEGPCWAYYLITLATIGLPWLLGMLAFHRAVGITGADATARTWCTVALAFGSILWPWSTVFANHSFAAACLAIGLPLVLRVRHGGAGAGTAFGAGAAWGLAASADQPFGIFIVAFAAMLLADPRSRRLAGWFVLPAMLAVGLVIGVNFAISGSVIPVQLVPAHFDYAGSPWRGSAELSGVRTNSLTETSRYALAMLLGMKGFLWFNPLLWLAALAWAAQLRRAAPLRLEAVAVGGATLVLVGYYVTRTNNYGGSAFGIRWFVPLLPFWYLFLGRALMPPRPRWRWFWILLAPSVAIAVCGLPMPFRRPLVNLAYWLELLGLQ